MADLIGSHGVPATTNGQAAPTVRRPMGAPTPTGSPSIRGPKAIMEERYKREAAKQLERNKAEQEQQIRLSEQRRRQNAEALAPGVAGGPGSGTEIQQQRADSRRPSQPNPEIHTTTRPPRTSEVPSQSHGRTRSSTKPPASQPYPATAVPTQAQPSQLNATAQPTEGPAPPGTKTRNSFPHAFERWETLSAHWEGLTSFWIRKLEQSKDEISRDPLSQQLFRQVTDLSAAGANLFHAVVELQRLRASSERKFQRWFFETRTELERQQEVNALMEKALENERLQRDDAIRDAVENERGTSKAQQQLSEMRKELAISKEEARRAWEELGRREHEERERTKSLQEGQPTIVGGVQVVPMTQAGPSRMASTQDPTAYVQSREYHGSTTPTGVPTGYEPRYTGARSDGGYSEGKSPPPQGVLSRFRSDQHRQDTDKVIDEDVPNPGTTAPTPTHHAPAPTTSAPPSGWTGSYSEGQDYAGEGYAPPDWERMPRHHHPTRLSDVIEEDDERSRTSASQVSRA